MFLLTAAVAGTSSNRPRTFKQVYFCILSSFPLHLLSLSSTHPFDHLDRIILSIWSTRDLEYLWWHSFFVCTCFWLSFPFSWYLLRINFILHGHSLHNLIRKKLSMKKKNLRRYLRMNLGKNLKKLQLVSSYHYKWIAFTFFCVFWLLLQSAPINMKLTILLPYNVCRRIKELKGLLRLKILTW